MYYRVGCGFADLPSFKHHVKSSDVYHDLCIVLDLNGDGLVDSTLYFSSLPFMAYSSPIVQSVPIQRQI